jgi:hypothetical protein
LSSSTKSRAGWGWAVVLGLPGLLGCAGTGGGVSLDGTAADAVRVSPAGSAALTFLDLVALRPDLLAGGPGLPPCVQRAAAGGEVTCTFAGCPAANAGALSGTGTVSGPAQGAGTYLETLDLAAAAVLSGAPWTWSYRGTLQVTVAGGIARVALADPASPVQVAFAGPGRTTAYAFTPTDLSELLGARTLFGTWQLQAEDSGDRIAGAIQVADPLVWHPAGCGTPASGTEVLTRFRAADPGAGDLTTVSFDQGCGASQFGYFGQGL